MAEASDVIIEVLDARDPLGCRCSDVERFIRKLDPSKKVILLLNKIGEQTVAPTGSKGWADWAAGFRSDLHDCMGCWYAVQRACLTCRKVCK